MQITKPELDWRKIIAVAAIYLGLLFFLISLHILAISTGGDAASVLDKTFVVFLYIYYGAVVFGFAGFVIQLLGYLGWLATAPEWLKQKEKKKKGGFNNVRP